MSYSPQSLLAQQKNNIDLYLTFYGVVAQSGFSVLKTNLESIRLFEANLMTAMGDNPGVTSSAELMKRIPLFLQQQTQLLQQLQETALATQIQLNADMQEAINAWNGSTKAVMEVDASTTQYDDVIKKQLDSFAGLMSAWTGVFKESAKVRSAKC